MQIATPVGMYGGGGYLTIADGTLYPIEAVASDSMGSALIGSILFSAYGTSAGNARAALSSISGAIVTPGTPAAIYTAAGSDSAESTSGTLLSTTSAFVAYKKRNGGTGLEQLFGAALVCSGTSITTVGTSALINNDTVGGFVDCIALTATQALVISRSSSSAGTVHLITIAGSSFVVTDSLTVANCTNGKLKKINGAQAALMYNGGTINRWREVVFTVASDTLSAGSETIIDTRVTNAGQGGLDLMDTAHTAGFYIGGDLGIAQICSFSGTSVTAGTAYTYAAAATSGSVSGCAVSPSQAIGVYKDNADNTAKAKLLNADGTAITAETSATDIHTAAANFDAPFVYPFENNLIMVAALFSGQPGAKILTLS